MNLAEMTGAVYVVDTNSWIKVQVMDVPDNRREALWQQIEALVTAGRIRTVQVAIEEAERNSPRGTTGSKRLNGIPALNCESAIRSAAPKRSASSARWNSNPARSPETSEGARRPTPI